MPDSQTQSIRTWEIGLGLAYVVTGIGLLVGLLTDSFGLAVAALAGILLLIVLSLGTVVRREGFVTPENKVIAACVLAAMVLLFGLNGYTDLPSELIFGIVFLVGVIIPHFVVQRLGYGTKR